MKKLENKEFKNIDFTEGVRMTYAQMISIGMGGIPVSQGMTFDQFDQHLDLKKKIDNANGSIDLSKDELKYLKNILPTIKWRVVTEEIREFRDYILKAY